jgi:peptidoglycan/LPS O-acetylase OafA/YrhL
MGFLFPFYRDDLVGIYGVTASFGVEIFFVLSGFLIGQLIIKEVLSPPSGRGLGRFYLRRWFRTLPPYYLVLALRTAIGHPFSWKFVFFVQNFDHAVMRSFPVSWSLSIEEWFYLITPFLLLLAARLSGRGSPRIFFLTCAAIALVTIVARAAAVLLGNVQPRDHIFLRMDTMMVGVVLGGLRVYHRAAYDRLVAHRRILFAIGLGGILAMGAILYRYIWVGTINESIFMRTLFFDPLSIAIGLWLLSLESSRRINGEWTRRRWASVIRFVSLTSYSMYLIHLSAFEPFWHFNDRTTGVPYSLFLMAIALAVSTVLAALMYGFFERPVLWLRDRWIAPTRIERAPSPSPATRAGSSSAVMPPAS